MRAAALRLALGFALAATAGVPLAQPAAARPEDFAAVYARQVDRRLELPDDERQAYAQRLLRALADAGRVVDRAQWVLLVDRHRHVQAAMLWWVGPPDGPPPWMAGASPVSTGRPSGFEHFETPTGVFEHSLAHPDFRAEGTPNENGVRGYGERGMRVFDFGWVNAQRGWKPGEQAMRLQVHATDPRLLEPRLGQRDSKGCIRIPATLNRLLDRHGLLDAAYEAAAAHGTAPWVLPKDRQPTPWSGRWLVVVDSQRVARPSWSPLPRGATRSAAAAGTVGAC